MNLRKNVLSLAAAALASLTVTALTVAPAAAQLQPGFVILGKDPATQTIDEFIHADLGVAYTVGTPGEPGDWDLHIHIDPPVDGFDPELEPDQALLYVTNDAQIEATNLPQLGIGAVPSPVWLIPESNPTISNFPTPNMLWMGIGAEENESGDFAGPISLFLRAVTGYQGLPAPGQFALWQQPPVGSANVFMATNDGISNADVVTVPVGGHVHFNWGFTAPGVYEVVFEAVGTPTDGGPTSSGLVTYYFGIGTTQLPTVGAAAPEPGALSLLALGLVGAGLIVRRRK